MKALQTLPMCTSAVLALAALNACTTTPAERGGERGGERGAERGAERGGEWADAHRAKAERFFRGVYGADPGVVDELAADDIAISYPIFEQLFDTPTIRGKGAVKDFATGFARRWAEPEVVVHESVVEGDLVALMWSFSARNTTSGDPAEPRSNWGGITLYRFSADGRIVLEVGEESEPGPFGRLTADGEQKNSGSP